MIIKKSKTAAVDLDDTLWDYVTPFLKFCEDKYGIRAVKSDVYTYDLQKLFGWTREKQEEVFTEFAYHKDNYSIQPFDGAKEVLINLNKNYERLIAITARSETVYGPLTATDIERNFSGLINKVYFTNEFWKNGKPLVKKIDICLEQNVGLLIEDSFNNILEAGNAGIESYLITQPWNITRDDSKLPKNVKRVAHIKEILKHREV